MRQNPFRAFPGHDAAQFLEPGTLHIRDASKFFKKLLRRLWPDTGYFAERRLRLAFASAQPVKSDRKAMGFVSDLLDQVEHGGVPLQYDGLIFLPKYVKNFFLLRDAGHRLIDNLE